MVHQIKGNFADDYYHQQTINKVWKELNNTFDAIQHIYFVAIDISSESLDGRCGGAKAYYEQRAKGLLIPASGHCFNLQIAVHELGHTFALEHDFRDDKYIMSYGANPNSISKCAAEWLNVHGFFNNSPAQINTNARILYGRCHNLPLVGNYRAASLRASTETHPYGLMELCIDLSTAPNTCSTVIPAITSQLPAPHPPGCLPGWQGLQPKFIPLCTTVCLSP